MDNKQHIIFLHGLESSSQGTKATLLRQIFPEIIIPDFTGALDERMTQLRPIMGRERAWVIIGSSFGGLMGALFTCQNPLYVRRLVLFAPALTRPFFAEAKLPMVDVPTVIYHGIHDTVVPLAKTRFLAERTFRNLTFHEVADDHQLLQTVQRLNWQEVLGFA